MKIKIQKIKKCQDNYEKVTTNFIYNRFDLFCPAEQFEIVRISNNQKSIIIEYKISGETVELGIWLVPITREEMKSLLFFINRNYPSVKTVSYRNGMISYGQYKKHNHFRIEFPETVEELENRLSHKSLVKLNKRIKKAESELGKFTFIEYDKEDIPDEIVNTFFKYKYEIYNREYHMTPKQYLDKYHVSNCYVLKINDIIGALRFSCEQCPIVNGENFSYKPDLRQYALGRIIFHYHLKRMVEKKHPAMFLSGGNYEYKTHYGSIEEFVYDGTIDLTKEDFSHFKISYRIKRKLPKKLKRFLKKAKHKLSSFSK